MKIITINRKYEGPIQELNPLEKLGMIFALNEPEVKINFLAPLFLCGHPVTQEDVDKFRHDFFQPARDYLIDKGLFAWDEWPDGNDR